jgi:hypothetical protein
MEEGMFVLRTFEGVLLEILFREYSMKRKSQLLY